MSDIATTPVVDTTNISVINTNIIYIQRDINDIKLSLKDAYATKSALEEVARGTEDRLARLERGGNVWKYVSPILASVVTALFTFFVIEYFTALTVMHR